MLFQEEYLQLWVDFDVVCDQPVECAVEMDGDVPVEAEDGKVCSDMEAPINKQRVFYDDEFPGCSTRPEGKERPSGSWVMSDICIRIINDVTAWN